MTHKAKVLALLSDGLWHSHHQGYGLGVMLHSRVANLRRDGYVIECKKLDGGTYGYRLVGRTETERDVDQGPLLGLATTSLSVSALNKPGPAEAVTSSDGVGVQRVARADVGASTEPGLANGGDAEAPAPTLFDAQRFVDGRRWEREQREAVQRRHG